MYCLSLNRHPQDEKRPLCLGYRNDGSYFLSSIPTAACLPVLLVSLVSLSKNAFYFSRASVRETPERVRVSLSRLRVQRYGNFFIPASISQTFLQFQHNFFHFTSALARVPYNI